MTTLEIPISPEAEAMLRKHAREAGLPAEAIAARLLERSLSKIPDLVAISGPIYEAFKAFGMTEDELSELLEREKHAMRSERGRKVVTVRLTPALPGRGSYRPEGPN